MMRGWVAGLGVLALTGCGAPQQPTRSTQFDPAYQTPQARTAATTFAETMLKLMILRKCDGLTAAQFEEVQTRARVQAGQAGAHPDMLQSRLQIAESVFNGPPSYDCAGTNIAGLRTSLYLPPSPARAPTPAPLTTADIAAIVARRDQARQEIKQRAWHLLDLDVCNLITANERLSGIRQSLNLGIQAGLTKDEAADAYRSGLKLASESPLLTCQTVARIADTKRKRVGLPPLARPPGDAPPPVPSTPRRPTPSSEVDI